MMVTGPPIFVSPLQCIPRLSVWPLTCRIWAMGYSVGFQGLWSCRSALCVFCSVWSFCGFDMLLKSSGSSGYLRFLSFVFSGFRSAWVFQVVEVSGGGRRRCHCHQHLTASEVLAQLPRPSPRTSTLTTHKLPPTSWHPQPTADHQSPTTSHQPPTNSLSICNCLCLWLCLSLSLSLFPSLLPYAYSLHALVPE